MKKFFTLLCGALITFGAAAQANALYLRGNFNSWPANSSAKVEKGADNSYTYKFQDNYQPEFKISTNEGTSGWDAFNNGVLGLDNGNLEAGVTYTLVSGKTENLKAKTAGNYTMTIVYENGSYKLTLSGDAEEWKAPAKLYVKGDINGWAGSESEVITLTDETPNGSGEYVYSGVIASLYGGFKINQTLGASTWDGLNYGSGGSISLGETVQVYSNGDNITCSGDYTNVTINFFYNPDGDSWLQLLGDEDGPVTYPAVMYLIGNYTINGQYYGWSPSNAVEMAAVEGVEGVYEVSEIQLTGADGGSDAYFSFCSEKPATDDWQAVGQRYGADATSDQPISVGQTLGIKKGDVAFKVANVSGNYKVVLDLANSTCTLSTAAGVEGVAVDANAPVEYFNLQGVRVANPENGLYIVRRGNKIEKVVF